MNDETKIVEDVGTCCDGKPTQELCPVCREEYETYRSAHKK